MIRWIFIWSNRELKIYFGDFFIHAEDIWNIITQSTHVNREPMIQPDQVNCETPGKCGYNLKLVIFQTHMKDRYLGHFWWNCPQMNATKPYWRLVNLASGNVLVPSGKVDPELCRHMASLGHNELSLVISHARWGLIIKEHCHLKFPHWNCFW